MSTMDLLLVEAHRLLDLWAKHEADYYAASREEQDLPLAQSIAAQYAASAVLTVRATAMHSKYTTAIDLLNGKITSERNRLVREHLDDVFAKLAPCADSAQAA